MLGRLYWILIRRHSLKFSLPYFSASIWSRVSRNSTFEGYNAIYGRCLIANSSFGLFTYASDAEIGNAKIGKFCCIAPKVIIGGGRHPTNFLSIHPAFYSTRNQSGKSFSDRDYYEELLPVSIGNDVWIGARAIVLDGITIGDGAIIAAGSIVARDVEPYTIVGGVPAKPIRKRFDDETIAEIISLKWWNWPLETLAKSADLFRNQDEATLNQLKKISFSICNKQEAINAEPY